MEHQGDEEWAVSPRPIHTVLCFATPLNAVGVCAAKNALEPFPYRSTKTDSMTRG